MSMLRCGKDMQCETELDPEYETSPLKRQGTGVIERKEKKERKKVVTLGRPHAHFYLAASFEPHSKLSDSAIHFWSSASPPVRLTISFNIVRSYVFVDDHY